MRLKKRRQDYIFDGLAVSFEAIIKGFSTKTVLIELGNNPTADKNPHHTGSSHPPKTGKLDIMWERPLNGSGCNYSFVMPHYALSGRIADEKSSLRSQQLAR